MKTSKPLLFGFLVLFTVGTSAEINETTVKPTTSEHFLVSSIPVLVTAEQKESASPGKHPDVTVAALTEPKPSNESLPSISTSKDTTVASKLPPKKIDAVTQTVVMPTTSSPFLQSASTLAQKEILQDASDTTISLTTHVQATVRPTYSVSTGKKTSPETTAPLRPTLTGMGEKTEMTMKPVQDELGNNTTGTTVQNGVIVAAEGPKHDTSGDSSQGKNYLLIILAVAFCILCLVAILVFMYRRHQHRSGSTNFNQAGWAGQVALPDDSALDRDIEAEAVGASGDREARRSTLVTFFGKRQSRLPSVAMEDISGKKEKEECQQLLDSDAGPEGSGEANGKLPEPTKQESEAASTPSKAEQGSS